MLREFVSDLFRWNLGTAWWNLRFNLGVKIGGFTSAQRLTKEELDR